MFNRPELAIFDLNNTLYDYEIPNESGKAALMSFSSKHLGKSEVEVSRRWEASKHRVKSRLLRTTSSNSRLLYIH